MCKTSLTNARKAVGRRASAPRGRLLRKPRAASESQNGSQPTISEQRQHGVLPQYEGWDDGEGLFPVRHPGSFPDARAHVAAAESQAAAAPIELLPDVSDEEFDPLRDGPLRYCGYANEVGEAFAAWLPVGGVPLSYAVAVCYVLVDTYDKASRAHREAHKSLGAAPEDVHESVDVERIKALLTSERAVDTLLWQLLASVAIPGFIVHQVVHFSHIGLVAGVHLNDPNEMLAPVAQAVGTLASVTALPQSSVAAAAERVLPTACGLLSIPFIVHPIDNLVHFALNWTLRPYMRSVICDGNGGRQAGLEMCELPSDSEGEDALRPQMGLATSVDSSGHLHGPAMSSFDYGACIEAEGCSIVGEYRAHAGDGKSRNVRRAVLKAVLLTAPVAVALLASAGHGTP